MIKYQDYIRLYEYSKDDIEKEVRIKSTNMTGTIAGIAPGDQYLVTLSNGQSSLFKENDVEFINQDKKYFESPQPNNFYKCIKGDKDYKVGLYYYYKEYNKEIDSYDICKKPWPAVEGDFISYDLESFHMQFDMMSKIAQGQFSRSSQKNKTSKFKKGDRVIFNPSLNRSYYQKYKGEECIISFVYQLGHQNKERQYCIITKNKLTIVANESELEFYTPGGGVRDGDEMVGSWQLAPEKEKENNIKVGVQVIVNGEEGKIKFENRKGKVKKIGNATYLIEFEEDDSKNLSSETMLVSKDLVSLISKDINKTNTEKYKFKKGDKVICLDRNSDMFNKEGEVDNVWDDDSCMVIFTESGDMVYMEFDQLMLVSSKKVEFNNQESTTNQTTPSISEEEEEDDVAVTTVPLKKEDLLEFSYKDFLSDDQITTHDDLLKIKDKYKKELENLQLPKMKKIFIERTIGTINIIESYYQFLINKIAKDLPVLRTVESIEDEDLLRTKTKVRASDSKELTRKYSFDQGIIAYWKFSDAIIFKTI
jgi:hypothetical protein